MSALRPGWVVPLLLVVSVVAVYGQLRHHEFVNLDDHTYILENPNLLEPLGAASVIRAFAHPYEHNWIPLTWISLHVDHALHGRAPAGYLLTNAALHLASALLLFAALWRMTGAGWASGFAAGVFALHPLHVESVAWASERKDALSGVFWMAALLAHAALPGARRAVAVAACLALSLLAKPMAVTLPFVLLLLDYWPLGRLTRDEADGPAIDPARLRRAVLEKLPLLALVAAASVVTYAVQQATGAVSSLDRLPLAPRLANALESAVAYVALSFWPSGLAVHYPYPEHPVWWRAGLAAAALLAVTAVALRSWRTRPWLAVGWLWYLGTLVPVIGLVQVGVQARADRYTYLPQIGLTIALSFGALELWERRRALRGPLAAAAAAALLALGIATHGQVHYWRDTRALYERALAVTERNFVAHRGLADELLAEGDLEGARRQYEAAARIRPGWSEAELGLADVAMQQGRMGEALASYERWVRQAPDDARAVGSLGLALLRAGRAEEARPRLQRGLELDPSAAELWAGLAAVEEQAGHTAEAVRLYGEALRREPGQATAANNLAWILATAPDPALRDPGRAIRLAEGALDAERPDPALLDTLAAAQAAAGRLDEAARTATRAVDLAAALGAPEMVRILRTHRDAYREGRAWVEPGP